jgi:acetyltransferase-like isoleucine patch superfamily enzyme
MENLSGYSADGKKWHQSVGWIKVGEDVFIDDFVKIKRPQLAEIGNHVAIDFGFYCTTRLIIGDYIHIAPYVTIIGGAKGLFNIESFASVAAGSRIICASDEHLGAGLMSPVIPDEYRDNVITSPVSMEPFSALGTNVVVTPGVVIREGSVIGANSFINKSTEPWTIYVGNPARPLKIRPKGNMIEYAKRLGYDF